MNHNLHDAKQYFQVGQVAGTHALKGEVRVFPMTDDRERFTKGLVLFLEDVRGQVRELVVERSRQNGKFVLLKFKGLDSINEVERFRGASLFIDRKDAIPLAAGEYFVADLIGLAVYDEDGALIGELTDVIETGANDVYAVRLSGTGTESSAEDGTDVSPDGRAKHTRKQSRPKEILLPVIPDCIREIDLANGRVTVHLMDGLSD